MKWISWFTFSLSLAIVVLCAALAGCDDKGGWYAFMECQQRDLKTGLCSQAAYSCRGGMKIGYYPTGPRCYTEAQSNDIR